MGYIYIHTNKVNGKKYIGQTVQDPSRRWRNGEGYIRSSKFYNAIKKYGWDNFEHEIRRCPDCLLDVMERNLIEYYRTTSEDFGYNLESGGNENKHLSEESKKKISEVHKGKHLSEDHKKKISEANKGRVFSKETKEKISDSRKGQHPSEESKKKMSENNAKYWEGKTRSEETRKRLSKSNEKFHYTVQSPSGEILETNNLMAFCKEHEISHGNISTRGRSKGWTVVSKEAL